jgi:predicted anti-sigma-YlaC factor YlaD
MIANAVRQGAYLNPTLHYEWGGMSRRAGPRELEDYRVISNPDLVYFPRNMSDSILARNRQIKNFSSRYDSMPWVPKLPAQDRAEFESLLKQAIAVDPGARPEWRLANLVMQKRARRLLARADELFPE